MMLYACVVKKLMKKYVQKWFFASVSVWPVKDEATTGPLTHAWSLMASIKPLPRVPWEFGPRAALTR
jgi:hypothetical protein